MIETNSLFLLLLWNTQECTSALLTMRTVLLLQAGHCKYENQVCTNITAARMLKVMCCGYHFDLSLLLVAPDIKSTSVGSDILGTSFGGDEECLGYPLIQQDDPPVVLTVTVTADPCPQVEWFVSATLDSSAKSPPNSSLTNVS